MRIVAQRVRQAGVSIEGKEVSCIKKGLLLLLGIAYTDAEKDADYLISKILSLRIFEDDEGKMNLCVHDVKGEILVVSQFTLLANCSKGNRPSFDKAADKEKALKLYDYFVEKISENNNVAVKAGKFGANMQVNLINDGPVTVILDSKQE